MVSRSSASRMLMKIETNGHALHTGKKCCGSEKGQEERTEQERITQLDLEQNRGFGTLFDQETRQKQILCPSKFERGSQLGISEDRNRQKPLLAKKSVSKRTHPCACTWTAVRKQKCGHPHGWLLISPFLNIGCLEIPVCGLNQMEMLQMK